MSEKEVTVILAEDVPQQDRRQIPWQIRADHGAYGTGNFIAAHWCFPKAPDPKPDPDAPVRYVGHPPHMHKETEIIMLIGMNPDDPYDLGATVEFSYGEKMEQHVYNRSCTLVIPGGTPHGNYHVRECTRPFMFIQIQEAVNRTEKFLWEYLTPEQIASMEHKESWQDVGFDDESEQKDKRQ